MQTNFGDQYPCDEAREGRHCGRYITQTDTESEKSRQYGTRQRVAIDDYCSAQHIPWFEHYANQITFSDVEFFRYRRLDASVTRSLAEDPRATALSRFAALTDRHRVDFDDDLPA